MLKYMHDRGNFYYVPPTQASSAQPPQEVVEIVADELPAEAGEGHAGHAFPPLPPPVLGAEGLPAQGQTQGDEATHGEKQEAQQAQQENDVFEGDFIMSDRLR